jgi:hypothetical protein
MRESDWDLGPQRTLGPSFLSEHTGWSKIRRSDQGRGAHISPLAAYDADTDRFLILDVSRYKYPPVWVVAAELFAAMNTTDTDNQDRTRGFVLLSAKENVH